MNDSKVFISYSRRNKPFVDRLMVDLEREGFELWRDTESLETGTPSWERAIRDAIKNAGAFVLVASPDALQSDYVQGELTLAKIYHCPIFPIWADGDQWIDCVPLDMANYQYVDGRQGKYPTTIDKLVTGLNKVFDVSEGTITLGLPTHETIELRLAQFKTGFDILSYIWVNYLQGWYDPFTYGSEWIIANVDTRQLAMPWQWLTFDVNNPAETKMLNMLAGSISYTEFGIRDGSFWAIWDARRLKAIGVFTEDDDIRTRILTKTGLSALPALVQQGVLERKIITDVRPTDYEHRLVIATFNQQDDRVAFVDT